MLGFSSTSTKRSLRTRVCHLSYDSLVSIANKAPLELVPGPTPYGTSPATVATTKWPTTATWNTGQQPTGVPTVVPGSPNPPLTTTVPNPGEVPGTVVPSPTPTADPGPTVPLYGQCGGVSR